MNDQSSALEVEDGAMDQPDIHDDALVFEFLRINMVPDIMSVKEQDHFFQRANIAWRYRLEEAHVFRFKKDGGILVVLHLAQRACIVLHAHEEPTNALLEMVLSHFGSLVEVLTHSR